MIKEDAYEALYPVQLKDPELPIREDCSIDAVPHGATDLAGKKKVLVPELLSIISPGTRLELYFSLGSSPEIALGVFFVDRAGISFPEEQISVSARDAVGKLLKEQTFDDNTPWQHDQRHAGRLLRGAV